MVKGGPGRDRATDTSPKADKLFMTKMMGASLGAFATIDWSLDFPAAPIFAVSPEEEQPPGRRQGYVDGAPNLFRIKWF